jgi:hypothetical protein
MAIKPAEADAVNSDPTPIKPIIKIVLIAQSPLVGNETS